jgi:hypothetical protein
VTQWLTSQYQARTRRKDSRARAPGAKLQGARRRHWNNTKYGASKLRLSLTETFLCKLTLEHAASGRFASLCPRPKKFAENRLKGVPNYKHDSGRSCRVSGLLSTGNTEGRPMIVKCLRFYNDYVEEWRPVRGADKLTTFM